MFWCVFVLFLSMLVKVSGEEVRLFTRESRYSVNETINRLILDIESGEGQIFARIDQKKAAEDVGLSGVLEETQVLLFGNPRVGTGLMVSNGLVSIELPLRASAWQKGTRVYLTVVNPLGLEVPYNLSSQRDVLQRMTTNIQQMMDKVSV